MGFSQVAKGGPDGSLCLGYAIALDRYRDSPEHARLWAIDRLHFLCRKVCDKVARSSIYFREPHGLDLKAGQCNFAIGSARKGLSRECGASGDGQCRGCHRNCERRADSHLNHWDHWILGRWLEAMTREPGDLLPAMVMRETRRAGCSEALEAPFWSAASGAKGRFSRLACMTV